MTQMKTVRTAELIGAALDWAVGIAVGEHITRIVGDHPHVLINGQIAGRYLPSTDWSQGGPLIEKCMVRTQYAADTEKRADAGCLAQVWRPYAMAHGDTLLIAACRAIVAANLGDEVQIPAELLP
ncbi:MULTISPECIES: phage protein NinX family protein [unclassified Pseudomonas]|uniref:phage protein NinX family protein n=1 Tax=unclassified Pseudomonas TaxID=196821 RepID=UPI002115B189|nr:MULTISPECIES: phage protein NinX family protein [unclassified Pseudomonas]MDW3712900.1 phage protein NinX family protein [Pseudomonas sp. 2023EL-01195]